MGGLSGVRRDHSFPVSLTQMSTGYVSFRHSSTLLFSLAAAAGFLEVF